MTLSPDAITVFSVANINVNATIVFTWLVMLILTTVSMLVTRRLSTDINISRWQSLLEAIIASITEQIEQVSHQQAARYLSFIGSLFMFIACSSLLNIVPGYIAPTGSLSTTTALAICVFIAVPVFGIKSEGILSYLGHYLKPTVFMLPFNVIGEFSRTIALAVRLYGNVMSGTIIAAILLTLTPYFFPVLMQLLGLLTGMIQAYIFSILAMVYIASASSARPRRQNNVPTNTEQSRS